MNLPTIFALDQVATLLPVRRVFLMGIYIDFFAKSVIKKGVITYSVISSLYSWRREFMEEEPMPLVT